MKLRSLLVLSLFSLAACPPPAPSPDAQADAQPEAASPSDSGGSMDSSSDGSSPSDSGSDSGAVACCVALAGTNQSVCDALVPLGRDRCNMINGGTSCAWSAAASCNDGGSSMPDASSSDASGDASSDAAVCCVARPGVSQSTCDAVASLGADRCNMLNGGASCMWQGGAACGDGGAVADSGVAGCCRAHAGVPQATCDAVASLGQDRCNMLNGGASCSWLMGADCRTDAGPAPDAGCCAARPGTAQATCNAVESLGRDRCNMLNGGASCMWTCS